MRGRRRGSLLLARAVWAAGFYGAGCEAGVVGLAVRIVEVSVVTALVTSGLPGLVEADLVKAEKALVGFGGSGWD